MGTLVGSVANDIWSFEVKNMATKDDVGTAVNEALAAAKASGEFDGADGITPTIGENGNWYLGETDTGKPSRGDTPQKGTDYWTEADQQSIVNDVLVALPTWEGGSY